MNIFGSFEDPDEAVELLRSIKDPKLKLRLSRLRMRQLASHVRSEAGARALWMFVRKMNDTVDPAWLDASALVLPALHDMLQIDLKNLSSELLERAEVFLRDEPTRAAQARKFFANTLEVGSSEDYPRVRAKLLDFDVPLSLKISGTKGNAT